MISPADLISSIARLTARIPGASEASAGIEAPQAAAGAAALTESRAAVPPEQTLVRLAVPAGDSLAGLGAPLPLDQTKAAFGLISTDEIRLTIDDSGSRTQTVAGATTSTSGGAVVHASTTKVQPAFLARLTKPKEVDQSLKPDAARQLAGAVSERIRVTPKVVLALAEAMRGDAQPLASDRAGVMASSILNAAMTPGWPQPLALQAAGPLAETQAAYAAFQDMDEARLLELVAALGGDEVLQARLISTSDDSDRRRKLLRAACILAAVVAAFVTALRMEVEELLGDFALLASGATPASWSGRIRLPLK